MNDRQGIAQAIGDAPAAALILLLVAACSGRSPALPAPPPATDGRSEAPPLAAEPYDAQAQVRELKELRDKGLITDDDFQARKKRLLQRGP